jgi:ADP-ribose pyrophosphatase
MRPIRRDGRGGIVSAHSHFYSCLSNDLTQGHPNLFARDSFVIKRYYFYMKKHGPWTILSSEIKYKNPWIEVREDKVIRPDGKDGIFGLVTMKAGVSILALDNENHVYLTKEFKYGVGVECLETISGGIDAHEESLAAAKRELKEEIGATAERWIDLGRVDPFTSVVYSPSQLFLATKLTFGDTAIEGTETHEVLRIPLSEAVRYVINGKITHAQSCVLILRAHDCLKSQDT